MSERMRPNGSYAHRFLFRFGQGGPWGEELEEPCELVASLRECGWIRFRVLLRKRIDGIWKGFQDWSQQLVHLTPTVLPVAVFQRLL